MVSYLLRFLCAYLLIISCKEKPQLSSDAPKEQVSYLYTDGNDSIAINMPKSPQRVATFAPHATEILLALGLGNKMIIASTEEEVLPKFQKDYEKIPQKFIGHSFKMNREAFLLSEPDFVIGYPYDMKSESIGTPQELIKQGIYPFVLESVTTPNATLDNVYTDILTLGKIFSVQDKAETIINKMKNKLKSAEITIPKKSKEERTKVMIVNSFNNGVWIGGALATDLIDKAYGQNVYSDVSGDGEWVSYESMLARNPDVIFITDIASRPMKADEKIRILKTNTILKDISAVKNNRIYKADLGDVSPSIRNVDFIIRMNKIFYQNGK